MGVMGLTRAEYDQDRAVRHERLIAAMGHIVMLHKDRIVGESSLSRVLAPSMRLANEIDRAGDRDASKLSPPEHMRWILATLSGCAEDGRGPEALRARAASVQAELAINLSNFPCAAVAAILAGERPRSCEKIGDLN